jgi:Cu+-exporting ATPase
MPLEPVAAQATTTTEWTCPMHPEIVRSEPGSCPICGMALEPRSVTLEERNPELDDSWKQGGLTPFDCEQRCGCC